MTYRHPTTRRHPRTAAEAFKDATYADPVYRPREGENRNTWGGVALAVGLGLTGAVGLVMWLSW